MGSSDHLLNHVQFKMDPDMGGSEYHVLNAEHDTLGHIGHMSWARKDTPQHQKGEIANIRVDDPKHRRQGIATAMYHHALDSGIKPSPLHSRTQTKISKDRKTGEPTGGGKAWVNYVGGPTVGPRKIK